MLFAQTISPKRNFIIYKSLLENYRKSTKKNKETALIFEKTLEQARNLANETIDFFDVDADVYYFVKYLAKECKQELSLLNRDQKIKLTDDNIQLLENFLNKNIQAT